MKRLLLALVLSVPLTFSSAQPTHDFVTEFLSSPVGQAFLQTYGALKNGYLNDVDDEAIIEGAINGMLEALADPYTSYTDPEMAAQSREALSGSYQGIGATIAASDPQTGTRVEIVKVFRDSPAQRAGLQRGDRFVEVDGTNVEESTSDIIASLTRGLAGSTVQLSVRRAGYDEPLGFSIVRGSVEMVAVEATVLPEGVGYVHITTFYSQTVHEQLRTALHSLRAQGVTSLILDLRDNGGGLLNQGILVADEFLAAGDIVFQRSRGATERLAQADANAFDLPMVVLVNRHSASASEIVAGALQDHGRAVVVGEETFGKGVGQSVFPLLNGGQLTFLSFEWLTPNGSSINQQGITPDVIVEDGLSPNVVLIEGSGVNPNQEVQIVVGGETIGTATADEDGNFSFYRLEARPNEGSISGDAVVNLEADAALRTAFELLQGRLAQAY